MHFVHFTVNHKINRWMEKNGKKATSNNIAPLLVFDVKINAPRNCNCGWKSQKLSLSSAKHHYSMFVYTKLHAAVLKSTHTTSYQNVLFIQFYTSLLLFSVYSLFRFVQCSTLRFIKQVKSNADSMKMKTQKMLGEHKNIWYCMNQFSV